MALILAIVLVVLVGSIAAALDAREWLRARSLTRAAVDAALITGLKALQIDRMPVEAAMQSALRAYGDNVGARAPMQADTISFQPADEETAVAVTGSVRMRSRLLGLFGFPSLKVVDFDGIDSGKAIRTVGLNAVQSLETVLVAGLPSRLDQSALDALKTAARSLADLVVWPQNSRHTARFGVVPFSTAINAGSLAPSVSQPAYSIGNFNLYDGTQARLRKSSCIGERFTASAFTDAAPTGDEQLSTIFSRTGSCQPNAKVLLPTSDRSQIDATIDALATGGSSAGHIGMAWAWYLLSPLWAAVLPFPAPPASYAATRPNAAGQAPVRKVAVLIADGGFDTQTCIASVPGGPQGALPDVHSSPGAVPDGDCVSPNGPSTSQSQAVCDGMKSSGISVFTIVFPADDRAADPMLMANCASSRDTAYRATTAAELLVAVRDIAMRLTTLIVTR